MDLSNDRFSQAINHIVSDDNVGFWEGFWKGNWVLMVLKVDNVMGVGKGFLESLLNGVGEIGGQLKILSVEGNSIGGRDCGRIIGKLSKLGLLELNLSHNPLGEEFFVGMESWKGSTVRILDLTATEMNSNALLVFLIKVSHCRWLECLKFDQNNF